MEIQKNVSDEEQIRQIRDGSLEASEALLEKYKELVIKKARAMYLIGGETDDLIQEGMIGLFKAIRDYRPEKEASFATFAGLCIDRQLYTAIQNSLRQKHMPLNSYVSLSVEEESSRRELWMENPEAILIDQENADSMNREIRAILSPLENKILSLFLDGDSYTQIACKIGRTPKSVDNALHRIRRKIRSWRETKRV
jgi:RNA polymerase sporulation-specific sigma factor